MSFANAKIHCSNCGGDDHVSKTCTKQADLSKNGKRVEIAMTNIATTTLNEDEDDSSGDEGMFGPELLLHIVSTKKTQNITNTQSIVLANKELVNRNWILLDSQSTLHIFKNKNLLKGVKKSDSGVRCYCNGGYQYTH